MASQTVSRRATDNLPADAKEIVGRRREAADIKRLLSSTRLLTLTGPGGVGKTRLALYMAATMRRAFSNGVWLVQLASLQDGELLGRAVAETLGVHDRTSRSSMDALIDHLRDNQTLLVLDNCEHLIDACAAFADALIRAVPEVRILATSREVLGVQSEVRYVVPPLSMPPQGQELTAADTGRYEAVALFLERARAIDPSFKLVPDHDGAAELCRLVDGIPLAIELAAVQLRVLSLDQIVERLGDHLDLLTQGYRTAVPRHQTLGATVAWSFALCSPQEQTLWQRLTVFSGGFDLDAAEEVCSGGGLARDELLPLLGALIDKSVLTCDRSGAQLRYGMLELLRQYGLERLATSGSEAEVRLRHLDHYRRLSERTQAGWFTPLQVDYFTGVVREMPNFRVALETSLGDPARAETGLEIITRLYGYWVYSGGFSEARYWLDRALQLVQGARPARFRALATAALFALMQGKLDAAMPLIADCSALARDWQDGSAQAMEKCLSGRVALLLGDYRSAVDQLEEAVRWYEENAGALAEEDVLQGPFLPAFYLALAAAFGRDPRAAAFADRCRRTAEDAGAQGEISMGVWASGIERWLAGETAAALELFRTSIRIGRAIGYRYGAAWAIECLAWATAAQGRDDRAARLLGAAASIREILGLSLPGFQPYADAHHDCEAALRARLGGEAFEAAVEQGAGLDFDEAVAYAVEDARDPDKADTGAAPRRRAETTVLTPRELEVAGLIAQGVRNKEIAARLVISTRTAEGHVEHILTKLGLTSRTQIAAWYFDHTSPPSAD
ncbi:LuxR family transcriptional regulator [Nonomuraea deserti]|uniref:LuxR family transcriptional regulator n=1 Tax=Nonomuraea deserti TaxID=1848322 RepID=A0A4R4VKM8_9ACTN|nr:LuxR C-terminal-related transcriptional regulator [Nonomuraea deserti]TDD02864.1 LuxR family transcriptional regulator [Nonomuraea deserti]